MGLFKSRTPISQPDPSLCVKRVATLRREAPGMAAAVDLSKHGVNLRKSAEAGVSLLKTKGISGTRWAVVGLLDDSLSMGQFYGYGRNIVPGLTEMTLGYSFGLDTDGLVPFGVFGSQFNWATEDITADNYQSYIQSQGWAGNGGSTNLNAALDAALELSLQTTDPVFLFIITDGAPNDRAGVIRRIKEMSQYPIFIKILVVGNDADAIAFVKKLDDLEKTEPGSRLIDNVDTQHFPDPSRVTPEQFAGMMAEEQDSWLRDAQGAGLVV